MATPARTFQGRSVTVTKPRSEVLALAGIVGVGGIALVFLGLRGAGGDKLGPTKPLKPGHTLSCPASISFNQPDPPGSYNGSCLYARDPSQSPVTVPATSFAIPCQFPEAIYAGPGMDTFTTFRVVQKQGEAWVTTHASGVAAVHVGGPTGNPTPTIYPLVDALEPQPPGCPGPVGPHLCAGQFPGFDASPICIAAAGGGITMHGGPARPGLADGVIEIYDCDFPFGSPQFQDCFRSPYCFPRPPVRRVTFQDWYQFT